LKPSELRTLEKLPISDYNEPKKSIKVFVHLAANKDAVDWAEARRTGTLVGINDETPYGYGRANQMGCVVTFSKASDERLTTKFLRLALRVLTGFDLLHAVRQGRNLLESDIVWTHTESQFLAVAAFVAFSKKRPKILGQSIWLFDRWESLNFFHKFLYRRLIDNVDILTVHSSSNLAAIKSIFPGKLAKLVLFGIPSEHMKAPSVRSSKPLRILAIGNDRHRDWHCFAKALDGIPNSHAVILSSSAPHSLMKNRPNLQIMQAHSNSELLERFAEATVVCVPLKYNLHASGITAIQEAVLAGVPVIATATGGLEDYFGPDTIRYVPLGDSLALHKALQEVAADPTGAMERATKAQQHMIDAKIGAEFFIRHHVELSREILSG
jgi:glycosyltransferase involved in cell wall biosynthesis